MPQFETIGDALSAIYRRVRNKPTLNEMVALEGVTEYAGNAVPVLMSDASTVDHCVLFCESCAAYCGWCADVRCASVLRAF